MNLLVRTTDNYPRSHAVNINIESLFDIQYFLSSNKNSPKSFE
jgi:hypothetical protein